MDPVEEILLPEILDLIFEHLTTIELKNCLLVSKLWHEKLSKLKCMKKFTLYIYQEKAKELNEAIQTIFKTRRNYRKISINFNNFEVKKIKIPKISWKCVDYSNGFMVESLWPINSIAECVRDLSLSLMSCENEISFNFPNLTNLTLYKNSKNVDFCFKSCKSLKNLNYVAKDKCCDFISELLINNLYLKSLCIQIDPENPQNFISSFSKIKFSIKNLNLNCPNAEVTKFIIKATKNDIEVLELNMHSTTEIIAEILTATNLENLTLNLDFDENLENLNIPINPTIHRLDITEMRKNSLLTTEILKSLPNLRVYKTSIMEFNDMMVLNQHCRHLEELYVESFLVNFLPIGVDLFENLVIFRYLDISEHLIKFLRVRSCERKKHFAKLIMKKI